MKKALALLLTFLLGTAMFGIGFQQSAEATPTGGDDGCTTEYSGWLTQSPGEGWIKIATRTVVDKEAYDDPDTTVIDREAQHYSLAGGSWKYDFSPTFTVGSTETGDPEGRIRWQANTSLEPHTQGGGQPATWVGPYVHYTSAGSSGNSDWFAFAPEVSHVVPGQHHAAVTHEEYKFKKVTCPEPFTPYEVDACWTMSHSDGVENTYEWPQTYGCVPPECDETVEYQYDTYWIRDEADEATLAYIKEHGMTGPESDASLEPHDYYSKIVTGEDCTETVPFPTPTVNDPCGVGNATWNVPEDTDRVHWTLTEDGRLIGVTQGKYRWPNGEKVNSWGTVQDSGVLCPPDDIAVTPQAVGVPDDCDGDPFGTITVTPVDGVTYTLQDGTVISGTIAANGTNTVTAHLAEGYVLDEGAASEWTFTSNPATDCTREPTVTYSQWVDGTYNCGDTTVQQTRTKSVTTYVWNVQTQLFEGTTVNTTETQTRNLSPSEIRTCPPEVVVVPVAQFGAPTPPTCDTPGGYSLPDLTPNINFTISPAYAGPGTYTVTATLVGANVQWSDGTTAPKTAQITVDGPIGFQSDNPEAPCYLEPTPDCENSPSPTTCPAPEGTRDEEVTKECVDGDLVTTETVSGTNPVWNEETLVWDLVPFAGSSQSIKQDARQCKTHHNPPDNPPHNPPTTPSVPHVIDAGLAATTDEQGMNAAMLVGLSTMLLASLGAMTVLFRRRREV